MFLVGKILVLILLDLIFLVETYYSLIDAIKDKKTVSEVVKNSGTSCFTCRSKIAPACWLIKRRCVECQLFCKCSNCDSDPLLAAKVPIWTVNEYRACYQCGSACISSQCSDNEYFCNNCFSALKAVDIDSDDAEEFMHIFEDGVAAASNPVSIFSDAAVISMENKTVQVEDANAMIVALMVSLFLGREHSITKVLFYITICLFILF